MSSLGNKPAVATGQVTHAGYKLTIGDPIFVPSASSNPILHMLPNGVLIEHTGSLNTRVYRSSDGGHTWERGHWGIGVSICNRRDGTVVAMDFMTYPAEGAGAGPFYGRGIRVFPDDYKNTSPPMHVLVDIPGAVPMVDDGGHYGGGPGFWRSIIEEEDGTLLAAGYGTFAHNDAPPLGYPREWGMRRFESFVVESKDGGFNWRLRAMIAGDGETGQEGFDEPVMVDLGDGELLVVMRTGRASPLHQARSLDHGYTWGEPESLHITGLNPDLLVLSDGTLVLSSGTRTPDAPWDVINVEDYQKRYVEGQGDPPLVRGGYIAFSRDGGRTYSEPLFIDNAVGQCYTSVVEPEPGKLLFAIRHNWRKHMPGDWLMGEGRNYLYPITLEAQERSLGNSGPRAAVTEKREADPGQVRWFERPRLDREGSGGE